MQCVGQDTKAGKHARTARRGRKAAQLGQQPEPHRGRAPLVVFLQGRCPPPRAGRGRPAWRAQLPRRAGGRSTSSSGRAPAGNTHRGRPRPSLNARNGRSGTGHRGTAYCPGRRHLDEAVVPRFVQQQGRLVDLGPGGSGGQAQRDGRAEEGVLAPGPRRPARAGSRGRPMLHACIDPSGPA